MEQNYTLTVIGEIETPLAAAAPQSNSAFLIVAVVIGICIAVLMLGNIYRMECSRYQKRYAKLHLARTGQNAEKTSWNILRLKEMVTEEEAESASLLLFDEDLTLSR